MKTPDHLGTTGHPLLEKVVLVAGAALVTAAVTNLDKLGDLVNCIPNPFDSFDGPFGPNPS